MIDNQVESKIIDNDIWVRLEDIVKAVHFTAETAMDLAEAGKVTYLAIQAHGLAEFGEGLDGILARLRRKHGVTQA